VGPSPKADGVITSHFYQRFIANCGNNISSEEYSKLEKEINKQSKKYVFQ
jgi:hypothetical protein